MKRRLLSLLLPGMFPFGNMGAIPYAGAADAPAAPEPVRVEELTDRRTASSKVYTMSDGSYQAVLYAEDVHYKDSSGEYQEIDEYYLTLSVDEDCLSSPDRVLS